jgi:hypothetical protein
MVLSVLAAYLLTALLVPVRAPVALSDDWTYARSVEILLGEGRLRILDIAGASAIPQILWGATFGLFADNLFGALRIATVVFIWLSGMACYGLCRELELTRGRSALGTAAYLFNPLVFSLSYSFMTDPYYLGLLVMSAYGYARGLRSGRSGAIGLMIGSGFAALAVAQRVLGVLIPIAVVLHHLFSRRLVLDRASVATFFRIVGLPVLAFFALILWLNFVHGVPSGQQGFSEGIADATGEETWLLLRRLGYILLMYVGLFVLPLTAAALALLPTLIRSLTTAGWLVVLAAAVTIATGLSFFSFDGRVMPYVPHFLTAAGLGPSDLVVGRGNVVTGETLRWITYACALSAVVFVIAITARLRNPGRPGRSRGAIDGRGVALLCLSLLLLQIIAVVLPSFNFRDWTLGGRSAPSLDRYILPLLPFVVVLGVWALERLHRAVDFLAWAVVAAFAVFSIVGVHDILVHQRATWDLAIWANEQGVENTHLDAGYAWDAYHLQEFSAARNIPPQTPNPTWWIFAFATAVDSSYVVAAQPLPDHVVVREREYPVWLTGGTDSVYLQRRDDVPGPP